jgi:hypothetical protein
MHRHSEPIQRYSSPIIAFCSLEEIVLVFDLIVSLFPAPDTAQRTGNNRAWAEIAFSLRSMLTLLFSFPHPLYHNLILFLRLVHRNKPKHLPHNDVLVTGLRRRCSRPA